MELVKANIGYAQEYAGEYYTMQDGLLYYMNKTGRYAATRALTGGPVTVQITGYAINSNGNVLFQTTTGGYIDLTEGWVQTGTGNISSYSSYNAQKLVNTIIANNKHIIANNILCARFASKLSKQQQEQLYELQSRLERRNAALLKDGFCTDIAESYPKGYSEMETYLIQFMNSGGVAGITLTIVVAAIVVASLSTAAFFAYQAYADESKEDVKFSDELTKVLTSKLTDEEYEQLKQETQGIVTKAKIKAAFGSTKKYLYVIGAGLIGFGLYKLLRN